MNEDKDGGNIWQARIIGDVSSHIVSFINKICEDDYTASTGEYYFAIVGCSCLIESVFEGFITGHCDEMASKKNHDDIYSRIWYQFSTDVSKSTGIDVWKKWFDVFFGMDLPKTVGSRWEVLKILFQLRNQLAHGRSTKFNWFYNDNGRLLGMNMEGSGYKRCFEHLLSKGVVSVDHGKVPEFDLLISKPVAIYFRSEVMTILEDITRTEGFEWMKSYWKERKGGKGHDSDDDGSPHDLVAPAEDP